MNVEEQSILHHQLLLQNLHVIHLGKVQYLTALGEQIALFFANTLEHKIVIKNTYIVKHFLIF